MDKHVNNPIATHSTEEQLDWVDQCKPSSTRRAEIWLPVLSGIQPHG
jgi:hypothetical protein